MGTALGGSACRLHATHNKPINESSPIIDAVRALSTTDVLLARQFTLEVRFVFCSIVPDSCNRRALPKVLGEARRKYVLARSNSSSNPEEKPPVGWPHLSWSSPINNWQASTAAFILACGLPKPGEVSSHLRRSTCHAKRRPIVLLRSATMSSAIARSSATSLAWIIHDFAGEKRKGALKD